MAREQDCHHTLIKGLYIFLQGAKNNSIVCLLGGAQKREKITVCISGGESKRNFLIWILSKNADARRIMAAEFGDIKYSRNYWRSMLPLCILCHCTFKFTGRAKNERKIRDQYQKRKKENYVLEVYSTVQHRGPLRPTLGHLYSIPVSRPRPKKWLNTVLYSIAYYCIKKSKKKGLIRYCNLFESIK